MAYDLQVETTSVDLWCHWCLTMTSVPLEAVRCSGEFRCHRCDAESYLSDAQRVQVIHEAGGSP